MKKKVDYYGRPITETPIKELLEVVDDEITHLGGVPTQQRPLFNLPPMKVIKPSLLPVNSINGLGSMCMQTIFTPIDVLTKVKRLIVPRTYASAFKLHSIVAGKQQIFQYGGGVLCEVFWGDDERKFEPIRFNHTVQSGERVSVTIENISAAHMPFNAVFETDVIT